jgi:formate hydrogenlyase transcriptional activator
LEEAKWKVAGARGAAEKLGIPPSTLSSRIKALGIQRPR